MSKKRRLPRRESFVLRTRTIRFIEEFPRCGTLRTISRAGLNGMEAIERGRGPRESGEAS
jgi:hypothetical protein